MPQFPHRRPSLRRSGADRIRQGDEIVVFKNDGPAEIDLPDPAVWGDRAIPESPAPHERYGIENVDYPDPDVWGYEHLGPFKEEHERRTAARALELEEQAAGELDA